ncbi:hypothetical protein [Vreelandella arcis]|uniref:Uncharacterized protein n=1 Tax=Vreelandella arcis TaxID=416873 RepID=A0A1H0JKR5_9GAMM|nr:hypothetical protein [Halomonas arcis]SDO44204.1 hypothetical protein SAMN04487951_1292 [Halomonas arcis]
MEEGSLKKYFYSNVASIFWSTILVFGGGVFVIYYALIGYMPDFDLKSSVAITAAASATSVVIILTMLGAMVLAGSFWGGIWNVLGERSNLKKYWVDNSFNSNFLNLLIWFAIPLLAVYLSMFIKIYFEGWYWLAILIIPSMLFLYFLCFQSGFRFLVGLKEFVFLVFATLVSASFMLTPLYFILKLTADEFGNISYVALLNGFFATVFLVFVNMASATPQNNAKPYVKEFVLGLMALSMVLSLFGKFDRIPYGVMKIYKFGNIQASELVLNKSGCELYKALDLEVSTTDYDVCIIKDVLILSRLGKEAYLEVKEDNIGLLRFAMPTSFIVSWTLDSRDSRNIDK